VNIDMQQNDDQVQEHEIRALDDDELCLVQGGADLFGDFAKFLLKTLGDAFRTGNGRPQV